jgi:hypothetical protein
MPVKFDHLCYILREEEKKNKCETKKFNMYIFFDYESYQLDTNLI